MRHQLNYDACNFFKKKMDKNMEELKFAREAISKRETVARRSWQEKMDRQIIEFDEEAYLSGT